MTRIVRSAASVLGLVVLAACSGGGGGTGPTPPPPPPPPPGGNVTNISMTASAFSPSTVNVPVGRQVVWTNGSSVEHTVTPDNPSQAGVWTSANLGIGATLQHTFNTAGTFNYHCNLHAGMIGTVVVQ